jgi:hypothetical protein
VQEIRELMDIEDLNDLCNINQFVYHSVMKLYIIRHGRTNYNDLDYVTPTLQPMYILQKQASYRQSHLAKNSVRLPSIKYTYPNLSARNKPLDLLTSSTTYPLRLIHV